MSKLIQFHGAQEHARSAEEHAAGETERRRAQNDWADGVLEELGYTAA